MLVISKFSVVYVVVLMFVVVPVTVKFSVVKVPLILTSPLTSSFLEGLVVPIPTLV